MRRVPRKRRGWKKKVLDRREAVRTTQEMGEIDDLDVKISLVQELIPIGLERVNELLQAEVVRIAGSRGQHGKENTRWGNQWGSVYLADQKIPVQIPRVRNKTQETEVALESYRKLQRPYRADEQVFKKLLNGLSMRKYGESAEIVPEVFGLSASNMSKRFKVVTTGKLRRLMSRDLSRHDFVAMFIDGKRFAEEGIVVAVGITIEGEKVMLGLAQMNTENHRAVEEFFDDLLERGLRFEHGLLFIVDGSRGLIKGIRRKFSDQAVIQRCQYHKRENVVSHLGKGLQTRWRGKLQAAYLKETYSQAHAALTALAQELEQINPTAANSLKEGMSDTLTLHRLGLNRILTRSFSNTNCIESILAQVEQYTGRVDRWRNGAHIQRWVAAGLLEVEPRLRRVNGWRQLPLLRDKIKEELARRHREKQVSLEQELTEAGV
jgi:putative transposase